MILLMQREKHLESRIQAFIKGEVSNEEEALKVPATSLPNKSMKMNVPVMSYVVYLTGRLSSPQKWSKEKN